MREPGFEHAAQGFDLGVTAASLGLTLRISGPIVSSSASLSKLGGKPTSIGSLVTMSARSWAKR